MDLGLRVARIAWACHMARTGSDRLLEGAATTTAGAAAGKTTATGEAAAGPSRAGRTGARCGDEHLVHVVGHGVHGVGKENGIEHAAGRRYVPVGRILDDTGEGLGPVVLDTEGHGKGEEFFEGVGRHALDT